MSSEFTTESVAEQVRQELRRKMQMLRTDLEDLERRAAQGFPPTLTITAVRALAMTIHPMIELAGELKGLEPELK